MATPPRDPEARPAPREWVTAGLWAAGATALLRAGAHHAVRLRATPRPDDVARELAAWDAARALLEALPLAVVAGLSAAWIAAATPRRGRGSNSVALVAAGAVLCFVAAGEAGPPGLRAGLRGDLHLDDLLLLVPLCLSVAIATALLAATAATRRARGARTGLVAGRAGGVLALSVALLLPAGLALGRAARAPRFERRVVSLDLLARRDLWRVVRAPEGLAPEVGVLTPAVNQHADSADKPSLVLAPGSAVEIALPAELGPGVLRAAAGVDRSTRRRLPGSVPQAALAFEVERDGEPVWSVTIASERQRPGQWSSDEWVWRHVGGDAGLAVEGGQRLLFRVRVPEGDPGAAVPPALLRAGFGELRVERVEPVARARATPQTPNLVLVVMDTLRADRVSCQGYGRPTTPHLDALAARGLLFERACATASWTWPSTASILTGLGAEAHGVTSNESCTLSPGIDTLAEVLQARGYTTAAFSGNPLITPRRDFDQGFERFDWAVPDFRMSDELVPAALEWLEAHASTRFFLYLHLVDPHTPHRPHPEDRARFAPARPPDFPEGGLDAYSAARQRAAREAGEGPPLPPPPAHQRWVSDLYDASVATGDRWFGALLEALEELGLDDRTVVAFTADHGEELLDRDRIGHGHGLHVELVHVPLVLAGPGLPAGVRVERTVSNRHLAPTLANLAGTELPGLVEPLLLHALDGSGAPGQAVFQTHKGARGALLYRDVAGLRRGDEVLHRWLGVEEQPLFELYDLRADPTERRDLARERPEAVAQLRAVLRTALESQRARAPELRVGVGAAGQAMLEHIGYAGGEEGDDPGPGKGAGEGAGGGADGEH